MAKSIVGIIIIFVAAFVGLYYLFGSGVLGISGTSPFQTGISLEPLTNIGNEAVNYISSILGISSVVVVIIIMAVIITKAFSKR